MPSRADLTVAYADWYCADRSCRSRLKQATIEKAGRNPVSKHNHCMILGTLFHTVQLSRIIPRILIQCSIGKFEFSTQIGITPVKPRPHKSFIITYTFGEGFENRLETLSHLTLKFVFSLFAPRLLCLYYLAPHLLLNMGVKYLFSYTYYGYYFDPTFDLGRAAACLGWHLHTVPRSFRCINLTGWIWFKTVAFAVILWLFDLPLQDRLLIWVFQIIFYRQCGGCGSYRRGKLHVLKASQMEKKIG